MILRRRMTLAVLACLAIMGAFPTISWAQLLPNLPLQKHKKTPCANESSAIQMYRREYFGYQPTCWRKFPTGWGCPSPEAPNAAAEFAQRKREKPVPSAGPDDLPAGTDDLPSMPGDGTAPGMDERPNSSLPPIPGGGGSPFDLNTNPSNPRPPAGNSPRGGDRPGLDGGPAGGPLDPPSRPSPGASARTVKRRQPTLASHAPSLDVPSFADPIPQLSSSASFDPLPGSIAQPPALGAVDDLVDSPANSSAKATAPKRTGLLAGLFGNVNTRRR